MGTESARTGLQLRSLVKPSGELEISLLDVPTPEPGPGEVLLRDANGIHLPGRVAEGVR